MEGASIIVMLRPSCSGVCSTTANSESSPASFSQQGGAALRVGLLAAAEHDRDLDLVLALEEALDVTLLGVVVVLRDLRAELDLTDRDLLLMLAGGLLLLRLLVLVLGVVEHTADGRARVGGDLDQVEVTLLRVLERVGRLHDADLVPVLADQANLGHADAVVDPGLVAFRQPPVEPTWYRH